MAFVVSARKYRPARFEDVVGQEHVSQTLKKALQTDHVAHAFLFCGPRGVGKTTCARILAKVLNCQNVSKDFEPCGECESCRAFNENTSFNIIELDAASYNSVDHIRALVEQVRFQPQQGKYKVYIIDEVHMLSPAAFNAFLKTLEEPPPYAIFILATTEKHKIIPTILSRCQVFDFKRIQTRDMVAHLQFICDQEGIQAEEEALHVIAQKADGALRDALSIFDRIVSSAGEKVTYEVVITNLNVLDHDYFFRFTDALLTQHLSEVLLIFDEVLKNGFEGDLFVNGLAEHLRNLLICKDEATLRLLEVGDSLRERYRQQAGIAPASFLLTAINLCNDCDINYKMARAKRLHVEMALIKMCYIGEARRLATSGTTPPASTPAPAANPEKKTADLKSGTSAGQETQAKTETAATKTPEQKREHPPAAGLEPAAPARLAEEGSSSDPEVDTLSPASEEAHKVLPVAIEQGSRLEELNGETGTGRETTAVATQTPPPSLQRPKSGSLPVLPRLDSLHTEVAAEEISNHNTKEEAKLTLQDLHQAWASYLEALDKDSVKSMLKGADVSIQGEQVTVIVGSALAENTIRQETGLMQFLRESLHAPKLDLNIRLDPSRSNAVPTKSKRLTDSEKYWAMKALNPLVDEVRKRFDLNLDNAG